MKKNVLWAIASLLLCLNSCGKSEKEVIPTVRQIIPLEFSIHMEPEVLPFPTTKTIPPLAIPEPSPKNPDEDTPTLPGENTDEPYTHLDYLVYPAGEPDRLIKRKRYTSTDADFGIVYDSLPSGDYQLCFLAHSDKELTISGQTAAFTKVSDMFLAFHPLTVRSGAEIIQDIDVSRVISRIEFVSAEALPQDLKSLEMNITGIQNKIDLATGLGISEEAPFTLTYEPRSEDIGKTGLTYSFQTFIPPGEKHLSVHLTAYSKEGTMICERDVADIKPIRNRVIRYTGRLYTPPGSDDTFTIHISNDGKWDDPIENDLDE